MVELIVGVAIVAGLVLLAKKFATKKDKPKSDPDSGSVGAKNAKR